MGWSVKNPVSYTHLDVYKRQALVSPIIVATSFPLPTKANSSVSIKLVTPYTTARVPTTFSFAIKPVIAAAANCHTPNPRGIKRIENG